MVVGFTTTYAINAYHHWNWEFESCSWRGGGKRSTRRKTLTCRKSMINFIT